ncbi:LysB family phage lysis regulatory protein [Citrobacter amalonaticus]|uniref:Rz-like lysis system protein LysB n=1 Tax=Citrobacter amalonaticus TaxID=35703 RepID=UPI0017888775|nr:Rz-like lysis system protein LysB [Citrobacter amalonaticus]MBE0395178.1 LysB family phage lysis regulatory protein [Citrobacter amalonaticus]
MKTLIVLLILAVVALAWLKHENSTLSKSFAKANTVATDQKRTIGMLKDQLLTAQRLGADNDRAQVELRQKLAVAGQKALRRERTITRLLNENEELRRWYDTELPAAVRSLHTRAPCASAGRCAERLPEGEPVPDAGK